MGAVANATVIADTATVNKVLSNLAAPEFKKVPVLMPLVYSEDMPQGAGTAVKGFRRTGSMTAAALAEATPQAVDANGRRQDTVADATAAKAVVVSGISVENQRFSINSLTDYAESAGRAIGRFVDDQGLALFSSITNSVDALGPLDVDTLDEAQYKILSSEVPDSNETLAFVGDTKAMRDLKDDVRTSGGAAFSNERFLSIFNGPPQLNGYFGSLPGYDLFQTPSGIAEVSTKNEQALFHPRWAFAGMFDSQVTVWNIPRGSEGVYNEMTVYYFWATILWNDGAACEVLSAA